MDRMHLRCLCGMRGQSVGAMPVVKHAQGPHRSPTHNPHTPHAPTFWGYLLTQCPPRSVCGQA